jgi:hypothetical protein
VAAISGTATSSDLHDFERMMDAEEVALGFKPSRLYFFSQGRKRLLKLYSMSGPNDTLKVKMAEIDFADKWRSLSRYISLAD